MHTKEVRVKVGYLQRWIAAVRKMLRASLKDLWVADLYSSQPTYF
jgi:hypothetical protein